MTAYVIANFGGPRTLNEIEPFLRALLTDKDVIRTRFPQPIHNLLFGRIAKKRAVSIREDYEKIGGGSPIWSDTECVAEELRKKLPGEILTFHRYLPATHAAFIEAINKLNADEICIFPMFPQFTYATTGSIARFFDLTLNAATLRKLRWVKSYPCHPAYLESFRRTIDEFLKIQGLSEEEIFFLFSAHGLPQSFIDSGDLYAYECRSTFNALMQSFPAAKGLLCFQSKFGPGEWLRPYTSEVCEQLNSFTEGRKQCVFVPLSFTSDHIETLFEVEDLYMPVVKQQGLSPYRVPALNRRADWIAAIVQILADFTPCTTSMLVRE